MTREEAIERAARQYLAAEVSTPDTIRDYRLACDRAKNVLQHALALPTASGEAGEPVAWRVKDFGDGWVLYWSRTAADHQAGLIGAACQPLYTADQLTAARAEAAAEARAERAEGENKRLVAEIDAHALLERNRDKHLDRALNALREIAAGRYDDNADDRGVWASGIARAALKEPSNGE